MWYLPVNVHLKHLFSSARDAKLMIMIWHAAPDGHKKDGKLQHHADARQWKTIDLKHHEFSNDRRNVRFVISADGMNPFGEMMNPHSTWLVIISLFSIPSWLCQNRKYLMLTILVFGLKQVGIDIDVFLEPLMEDMHKLWEEGVRVWDAYREESFTLYAIIVVTINDNLAHLTLNGRIKGRTRCFGCVDQTTLVYLTFPCQSVYIKHRWFLIKHHKYCAMKQQFDGELDKELHPTHCSGKFVFEMVRNIRVVFGKGVKEKMKERGKCLKAGCGI
jgi:hypothetical protein